MDGFVGRAYGRWSGVPDAYPCRQLHPRVTNDRRTKVRARGLCGVRDIEQLAETPDIPEVVRDGQWF